MPKTIENFRVSVKFFNKEKGYGFFSAAGTPDIFVHGTVLKSAGFTTEDMTNKATAQIAVKIKDDGQWVATAVHRVGDKQAKPQKEEAPVIMPEIRVGRTVQAVFKCGFVPGDMKTYGFFTVNGADIFVHESAVPHELWDHLETGKVFEICVIEQSPRGFVGRVVGLPTASNTPASQPKQSLIQEPDSAEADKLARRARREERRQRIMARGKIDVTDGRRKLFGVPVVGDEWECLIDGTHVVVCREVDDNGNATDPIEAFVVSKKGGKPTRLNPCSVTWHSQHTTIEPTKTGLFKMADGSSIAAPVYQVTDRNSLEQLMSQLRKDHDGEYFAIRDLNGKVLAIGQVKAGALIKIQMDQGQRVEYFPIAA